MLGMGHFEAAGNFDDKTDNPEVHSAMTAARAFRENSKAFVNLSIYEQRLHRSMKEALRQLRELQTERREREKTEMDDAIRLRKAETMKGLPYDPARDSFVYANAEIESGAASPRAPPSRPYCRTIGLRSHPIRPCKGRLTRHHTLEWDNCGADDRFLSSANRRPFKQGDRQTDAGGAASKHR